MVALPCNCADDVGAALERRGTDLAQLDENPPRIRGWREGRDLRDRRHVAAEVEPTGDRDLARRYTASLSIALVAIMVVMIVCFTAVVPLIKWDRVLPTTDLVGRAERPWAVPRA